MNIWLMPSAFAPHRGGVEEITLQLARCLQQRRHQVLVITNRYPRHLPASDVVEGVQVLRFAFAAPRRTVAATLSFGGSLVKLVRDLTNLPTPDLIHVQCASVQLAAAVGVATLRRIPLVLTTHGEVEVDANGLFQTSLYARRLFQIGARRATVLTACSEWAATEAARVDSRFSTAIVIPNGIDPHQWPLLPRVESPVVAAWGRHVSQKGFDLLLDAWPLVLDAEPAARLLIGGEGSQTRELMSSASDGVDFVGALDRSGVLSLLARSRIVVVPSRVEPFGIVALEAMATGRPVVWSWRGGLAEATGGLGWRVDPHDSSALAENILRALRSRFDPEIYRERAAALSLDEIADQYLSAYVTALAQ